MQAFGEALHCVRNRIEPNAKQPPEFVFEWLFFCVGDTGFEPVTLCL